MSTVAIITSEFLGYFASNNRPSDILTLGQLSAMKARAIVTSGLLQNFWVTLSPEPQPPSSDTGPHRPAACHRGRPSPRVLVSGSAGPGSESLMGSFDAAGGAAEAPDSVPQAVGRGLCGRAQPIVCSRAQHTSTAQPTPSRAGGGLQQMQFTNYGSHCWRGPGPLHVGLRPCVTRCPLQGSRRRNVRQVVAL